MGNRKAATEEIVRCLELLLPGSESIKITRQRLEALSDKAFAEYMRQLRDGEQCLSLQVPNLTNPKLEIETLLRAAEKLKVPVFERIWVTDQITGETYQTPKAYPVVDLPVRRQQQMLIKKISIPEDNRHVDDLTGQPSGPSASSSISFPELQVLSSQGLDRSIEEMIKFRGGDTKAFEMMNRQAIQNGTVSQDAIKQTPTKVRSTETLNALLKSMHLDNTL